MQKDAYPDVITNLPEADLPFEGARGWLAQGETFQIVFFHIGAGMTVPPHSHGTQWGFVIDGVLDLTVGGETRRVGPGETYYLPAGVEHSAHFLEETLVVDFFADVDRYAAKS